MTTAVIGYAGMTHLGLNSAVAAAEKGFETVCYDADSRHIAQLARNELSIVEPDLSELLGKNIERIKFTTDLSQLKPCDLVYIASDVLTDDLGKSDLEPISTLIAEVATGLRPDAVMVVLSQVPPGFTRGSFREDRQLYYQVETLIFGQAIQRALHPERFIVGCADPHEPLPPAFAQYLESFDCPILPMRYESAELAKISINVCLVASVSVANTMAELCESIGADWSEIVPSLKLDRRIGQYSYLAPGLGIGGGNLERDLATVCNLADQNGTDAGVVRAWIANSHHRRDWVLRSLYLEVLSKTDNPIIAVLGLAYKQDTDSTKNSPSIALLDHLQSFQVRVFDPVVPASIVTNPRCHGAESEYEACEGADVLAVMTPWSQFKELDLHEVAKAMRGRVVLDPYGVFDSEQCGDAGLSHHTLGVGASGIGTLA